MHNVDANENKNDWSYNIHFILRISDHARFSSHNYDNELTNAWFKRLNFQAKINVRSFTTYDKSDNTFQAKDNRKQWVIACLKLPPVICADKVYRNFLISQLIRRFCLYVTLNRSCSITQRTTLWTFNIENLVLVVTSYNFSFSFISVWSFQLWRYIYTAI